LRFHEIYTPVNGACGYFSVSLRWKYTGSPHNHSFHSPHTDAFANFYGHGDRHIPAAPDAYPEPYWEYSIEYLRSRTYGGGKIEIAETLGQNSAFTRHYFRYDSDGLSIYGFANIPHGDGPFPVIIVLHGYIEPEIYQTLDYTTHYADALASAGYLMLHPNLRGYPPSDEGDNLFRVGMAIDVLNLIALVKENSGQPDLLQTADPTRIGLWGHSMGGGISTRVLTSVRMSKQQCSTLR